MLWLFRSIIVVATLIASSQMVDGRTRRILLDTDVDTDDLFALLYILKLNRSQFDLQAVTVNTNSWTDAGHAVNQIYDILYMMGRDDIAVGVGGEGGILEDGIIQPNVGGYLPLIEQGINTTGYCRYRQTIPAEKRLQIDTNNGFRRSFLPQGRRKYYPLMENTAQKVMQNKIAAGPITLFLIGSHTNAAIFLMRNPHLKRNIEHIYVMGGSVQSKTDCCDQKNTHNSSCNRHENCIEPGNLFTDSTSNPYAEFNIFMDPFAAYQVIHSGIPVTLIPLGATDTIPISKNFFDAFEQNQHTFEAQYLFKSLKMLRDTWFDDKYYTSNYMWDSFACGVATSIMRNSNDHTGKNDFAEVELMYITVVTSNKPYGISDGSNPFFDGRESPKFNLAKGGVHSGHVQNRLRDPFCIVKDGKGRCQDGYTKVETAPKGVPTLVATKAKPNKDRNSPIEKEFSLNFLNVINIPQYSGRFNFTTQFPYYREVKHIPVFGGKKLGKNVVFDMDMSPGDFLALFYLLKVPVDTINLKAILVSPTGWANAATIDVVYDLLHMMGRDDIPVGLGDFFAMNQSDTIYSGVGDCFYSKAIPYGSGGFLDSDTLYGLARLLPRSPRRYTAENSVKYGAPRDTDNPELRQQRIMDVWKWVAKSLDRGSKITILTNGPLTSLAKIILADKHAKSLIQEVIINGGNIINQDRKAEGNVVNIPSNKFAELNMFLDPFAAKTVIESGVDIKLIPLRIQREFNVLPMIITRLSTKYKTPESHFSRRLLKTLLRLQTKHQRYKHMDMFMGEIIGAVNLGGGENGRLKTEFMEMAIRVVAKGMESEDGETIVDEKKGKLIKVMVKMNNKAYYNEFTKGLEKEEQSAVIGSFEEQKSKWRTPPHAK
ncbi:uncharacterized protein LOC124921279 [Impatiens glandulifera]|uniref:uncharacterized protein LOC124921279 n=1 Tax=Impatiens glandulifera TaxID=253017 RepID=UPI001FB0B71F|nr:uncharacterized protein LOC124921279 [Impatiens glandulifera]